VCGKGGLFLPPSVCMRIVSMLSSATEIVYALGLGDRLVAISHECDYPPEALTLPRASRSRFDPAGLSSGEIDAAVRQSMEEHGSVYEVDVDVLERLGADLVLTQAVCEVCAVPTVSVLDAVKDMERSPRVESLDAHTIGGIIDSVQQVAEAAGEGERGAQVAHDLRSRLDIVRRRVSGRHRPRVLMLEWLDPPFAPGHWVPEMVDIAGGDLLLGRAGERSEQLPWSDLQGLQPEVLLVEPCGYDLVQTRVDADAHRPTLLRCAGEAVELGQAWLLHSSYFSRSGPRVVDGVEALAALLHPEAFPGGPDQNVAERW
jgi:iron complex transport system substrate-binding protein